MKGVTLPEDEVREAVKPVAIQYRLSNEVTEHIVEGIAWYKVREHFDREIRADQGNARDEIKGLERSCNRLSKDLGAALSNVYTGSHLIDAYAGKKWSRTTGSIDHPKAGGLENRNPTEHEFKYLTPEGHPQFEEEYEKR